MKIVIEVELEPISMIDVTTLGIERDVVNQIVRNNHGGVPYFVKGAVVLRNDGFAHLMPDERTRQTR